MYAKNINDGQFAGIIAICPCLSPSGHWNLRLMSKCGKYHVKTPIDLIVTPC